jgi:transcriptional regulator with XRE-family HTH domain
MAQTKALTGNPFSGRGRTGEHSATTKRAPREGARVAMTERNFGQVLRERRRQLDLTQEELARRIRASTPYIGHLESGKRHPSPKILVRLADVLALDRRELFLLANPGASRFLEPAAHSRFSWEQFRRDDRLRRLYNITNPEMDLLSRVAGLGRIRAAEDLIHVLATVRYVLGR